MTGALLSLVTLLALSAPECETPGPYVRLLHTRTYACPCLDPPCVKPKCRMERLELWTAPRDCPGRSYLGTTAARVVYTER